ncbi:MAG: HAMP domain-containing sensor histidine kinase [Actinomycetota bacterium]|jgi:signal transduction histidine kinase|nr:HAMP domain-containing sensor histidine kinase [Actinomycetota bacterium]
MERSVPTLWAKLVEPSQFVDVGRRTHARLLSALLLALIPSGLVATALTPATRYGLGQYMLAAGATVAISALYLLSRTRFYRTAVSSTLVLVSTAVFSAAYFYGYPSSVRYFATTIILASVLTSFRATVTIICVHLAAISAAFAYIPHASSLDLYDDLFFIVIVGALALIVSAMQEHELRRLQDSEDRYREANAALKTATRAKDDFLTSMSHELRTPLNSIIGFSGVMLAGLAGDLSEEHRKQVKMISNSGQHLLVLVNQALELGTIDSGHTQPEYDTVDVAAIALAACNVIRPMADAKGIEVRFSCPDQMAPVHTDGSFVTQILLNLVGNAVKFTNAGHVFARVSQDDAYTAIAVEDTGCGMDPEVRGHVFEEFYQGDSHRLAKNEGTGLGLAVSKRLASMIGASIEVVSESGHGSVFTLRLPTSASGLDGRMAPRQHDGN